MLEEPTADRPQLNPLDLLRKRPGMRIHVQRTRQAKLQDVIGMFGLTGKADDLLVLTPEQAVHALIPLLHKDMAYSSELMPENEAATLAHELIRHFADADALIYTSGEWRDEEGGELIYCSPFTGATFDAGFLVRNKVETIAIWFEDED